MLGATKRFRQRRWGVLTACIPAGRGGSPRGGAACRCKPSTTASNGRRPRAMSPSSPWAIVTTPDPSGDWGSGALDRVARRVVRFTDLLHGGRVVCPKAGKSRRLSQFPTVRAMGRDQLGRASEPDRRRCFRHLVQFGSFLHGCRGHKRQQRGFSSR